MNYTVKLTGTGLFSVSVLIASPTSGGYTLSSVSGLFRRDQGGVITRADAGLTGGGERFQLFGDVLKIIGVEPGAKLHTDIHQLSDSPDAS